MDLDHAVLLRRTLTRYGGVAAIARRWPWGQPPHRSTILRWLRGQTYPRDSDALLALAAAIDVDPLGIWRVDLPQFGRLCELLSRALITNSWEDLLPGLSFLPDFVLPSRSWPPQRIARMYFKRDWHVVDVAFGGDTARSVFTAFALVPDAAEMGPVGIQVWHFAWRPAGDRAWRPYGFVRLVESSLQQLFSFSGRATSLQREATPAEFFVETWLGPGPVEFRIASLHPFSCREYPVDAQPTLPRLRFE